MRNPDYNCPKEMAWSTPQYARHEVNHAGDCLIADEKVVWIANRDQMLAIINNWRSSHSFPLQRFKMTLLGRARAVDPKAIIAQRLKRLVSIEAKLRRFPQMRLTQMQDVGGCRAVVRNIDQLNELVKKYAVSVDPRVKTAIKETEIMRSHIGGGTRFSNAARRFS